MSPVRRANSNQKVSTCFYGWSEIQREWLAEDAPIVGKTREDTRSDAFDTGKGKVPDLTR